MRGCSRMLLTHCRSAHCLLDGVDQGVQVAAFVVGFVVGEILLDVFERLGEHIHAIPELVELGAGDDELVVAEAQLGGPAAGFVVALPAGSFAVLAGTAGSGRLLVRAPAPAAPGFGFD